VKAAIGLGNPGPQYSGTRHNVGFLVIDELARRWNAAADRYERRYEALLGAAQIGDQRVLLLKPLTYMNLSGRSVLALQQFYKLAAADLMILCDDLDLPVGQIRLRAGGSGGGQKGLENVLLRLADNDVPRLRIGIGRADRQTATEYVLGRFAPDEREAIEAAVARAADAVACWLKEGIESAMNRFNAKCENRRRNEPTGSSDDASKGEPS
jgi:peptidyl-tRNA hydrolase, PTH1 family